MICKDLYKRFDVLMLKFSWLHMSSLLAKLMKDERCCMESRVLWCKGKDIAGQGGLSKSLGVWLSGQGVTHRSC